MAGEDAFALHWGSACRGACEGAGKCMKMHEEQVDNVCDYTRFATDLIKTARTNRVIAPSDLVKL
jgi:hypothetical protein